MPSRLLLATKPLFQVLDLILVPFPVFNIDDDSTFLIHLCASIHTEAGEEKDLHVENDECLVAEVGDVLGVSAEEVGHLELDPGGGQGQFLVDPAHVLPPSVVGVEQLLALCEREV